MVEQLEHHLLLLGGDQQLDDVEEEGEVVEVQGAVEVDDEVLLLSDNHVSGDTPLHSLRLIIIIINTV